jgi:hypothetical protein
MTPGSQQAIATAVICDFFLLLSIVHLIAEAPVVLPGPAANDYPTDHPPRQADIWLAYRK